MAQSKTIYQVERYTETYDGGGSGFGPSEGYYTSFYSLEKPTDAFCKQHNLRRVKEVRHVVIDGDEYVNEGNGYKSLGWGKVYQSFQDIVDEKGQDVFQTIHY